MLLTIIILACLLTAALVGFGFLVFMIFDIKGDYTCLYVEHNALSVEHSKLRAEYDEIEKMLDDVLSEDAAEAETIQSAVSAVLDDPLRIVNPMFTFREFYFTAYGQHYVDKHIEYKSLMTHIDTSIRNGSRFAVMPLGAPADDEGVTQS